MELAIRLMLVIVAVLLCSCASTGSWQTSPVDGGLVEPASNPPATSVDQPYGNGQAETVPADLSALLNAELSRVLAMRGITLDEQGNQAGKVVSSLPPRVYTTPNWFVVLLPEQLQAAWPYDQTGDYDQNGEVNVADLTPVGIHYGKTTASADWSKAKLADGDGNGEVNIADVTPIGLNFGIQVAGYVVETQDYPGGEFREFGYIAFSEGQDFGNGLSFIYRGAGGSEVTDVRIAPVGPTREFDWGVYPITNSSDWNALPSAATINGLPSVAFVDIGATNLYFAQAESSSPTNASQWSVSQVDSGIISTGIPPVLQSNGGLPAVAYVYFAPGPGLGYAFSYNNTPQDGDWVYSGVAVPAVYTGLDVGYQQGAPWVFYDDSGLRIKMSGTSFPVQFSDWSGLSANPLYNSLGDFQYCSAAVSGDWSFAAGIANVGGTAQLVFNRSTSVPPVGPLSFSEYIMMPVGSFGSEPSLAMVGGIPNIAVPDYTGKSIQYLAASGRTDFSIATWSRHTVFADHTEFEHPALGLLDGKPAVCWAGEELHFAWARVANPQGEADWFVSTLSAPVAIGYRPSLAAVGGVPFIAFCQDNGSSGSMVSVAVASEK